MKRRKAPREALNPLEPLLAHLWATLFHHLHPMGKGYVEGFL